MGNVAKDEVGLAVPQYDYEGVSLGTCRTTILQRVGGTRGMKRLVQH